MKEGIHPTYYQDALVVCACGNTWRTGSTKKEIHTDVCYNCHPFYTGEQRIVDTAGQVERFMKRTAAAEQRKTESEARPNKKQRRAQARAVARGIPEEDQAANPEEVAGGPVQTTVATAPAEQATAALETSAQPSGEERRPNRPPRQPRQPRAPRPRAEQAATAAPAEPSTPAEPSAPAGEAPAE